MAMAEMKTLPPPFDGASATITTTAPPTYSVTFILPEIPAEETSPDENSIENAPNISQDDNLRSDGS